METSADALIKKIRATMIVLTVAGALVLGLGWPRTLTCNETTVCDGTSGSWAVVWVGLVVLALGVGFFAVWAAAVGARLALRADREERSQVDIDA